MECRGESLPLAGVLHNSSDFPSAALSRDPGQCSVSNPWTPRCTVHSTLLRWLACGLSLSGGLGTTREEAASEGGQWIESTWQGTERAHVQTAFSMIKAKCGDAVRSKSHVGQLNEVLCKVLCHNICAIIQAMHALGILPSFHAAGGSCLTPSDDVSGHEVVR